MGRYDLSAEMDDRVGGESDGMGACEGGIGGEKRGRVSGYGRRAGS